MGGPTQLHSLLPPDVQRLVIIGLAGDYCVKETALDGLRLGYSVQMPLALTRFVNLQPGDDQRTIDELREAGVAVA
jgi:nicotinamidase/pyrazinamidase